MDYELWLCLLLTADVVVEAALWFCLPFFFSFLVVLVVVVFPEVLGGICGGLELC